MKVIHSFAFTATLVAVFQSSWARLREYDESCSIYKASENCRPDLDLVCHEDVCVCKEMAYYDVNRKACVALIGESCTPEQSNYYYGYSNSYVPTISRCPLNAVCEARDPNKLPSLPDVFKRQGWLYNSNLQSSPRCLCKQGFYPDEDLENCYPSLAYNETCSDELEKEGKFCDVYAGVVCSSTGTCACNSTENTRYDSKTRRCVTGIDEPCNSNTFCETNSICSTTLDAFKSRYNAIYSGGRSSSSSSSSLNTEAVKPKKKSDASTSKDTGKKVGKCVCLPGFTINSEGKCVGSFSVSCSVDNPCNADKFLSCVDGICQCDAGSHQAFSSTDNSSCVLLPGSSCKESSGPTCTENSMCGENGICQCKAGFSESPSGKCLLSYEKECIMPNTQQPPYNNFQPQKIKYNDSCNFYQGLSCVASKCECFDSQLKWDSKRRICTAGLDERCGSVMMMSTSELDFQQEPFYPQAYLYLSRRPYSGNYAYVSAYFVSCAEGLTCTKEHHGIEGWRVCEKK